jgi:hypothetical protein
VTRVEQAAARPRFPKRVSIALALAVAALGLSQVSAIVRLAQRLPSAMATEGMARYEKRFAEARKVLPRTGIIGYLSDPQDNMAVNDGLYERRYHAAEYHLAPAIIADSTEPQIILGNFFSPTGMKSAMAGHKFRVLYNFQNGVLIFGKEGS